MKIKIAITSQLKMISCISIKSSFGISNHVLDVIHRKFIATRLGVRLTLFVITRELSCLPGTLLPLALCNSKQTNFAPPFVPQTPSARSLCWRCDVRKQLFPHKSRRKGFSIVKDYFKFLFTSTLHTRTHVL